MVKRNIIFVPGKNPKPAVDQHQSLLWRTLLEGVRRAEPQIFEKLQHHSESFVLAAWTYLYYQQTRDISRDLPWIDTLLNTHGATPEDIREARSWHRKLDRLKLTILDMFPAVIALLPKSVSATVKETNRYFKNKDNIACDIREVLKQQLRPMLENKEKILIIAHSLGSVIAYDTLWELSHIEKLSGKIDCLLTIGSPLGMNYVQRRLLGNERKEKLKYPTNIYNWINVSATGDKVAVDRILAKDFAEMINLGIINSIEDYCDGIYNFFHNEQGLNCHRSYGYLVNPVVGNVIANWWKQAS
jgi:hypothetical protein